METSKNGHILITDNSNKLTPPDNREVTESQNFFLVFKALYKGLSDKEHNFIAVASAVAQVRISLTLYRYFTVDGTHNNKHTITSVSYAEVDYVKEKNCRNDFLLKATLIV